MNLHCVWFNEKLEKRKIKVSEKKYFPLIGTLSGKKE
jgi:hypothetical protein